jgi:hypothetical protein
MKPRKLTSIISSAALICGIALAPFAYAAPTDTGVLDKLGSSADDVTIDGDGNIYVTGVTAISDSTTGGGIIETADTADMEYNLNINNSVYSAIPDGSGGVYIGGTFTSAGGSTRNRVAHFDSSGSLTSFNPNVGNGTVKSMALSDDGTVLYIGGTFTLVGGETRNRLAAVSATTGAVSAWDPDVEDGNVLAIVDVSDRIYIGGSFTTAGADDGCPARLCALDASTANDDTAANIAADVTVTDLLEDGSTLYVSGGFTTIGGTGRTALAAIDTTTDTLTAFNPTISGGAANVVSMVQDSNNIYAMGGFTTFGGSARNYIGALSKSTGLATAWAPTMGGMTSGSYVDIVMSPDEDYVFVAAHNLSSVNGTDTDELMAKINVATGALEAWDPDAQDGDDYGFAYDGNFQARGFAYLDSGSIFIPGSIDYDYETRGGGGSVDSSGNARAWDPEAATGNITDMEVFGSYVYVAGTFDTLGGENISALGRVNLTTGAVDATWDPGLDTGDSVTDLDSDGTDIYFVGNFTDVNGTTRNYIASVSIESAGLNAWNPNSNAALSKIVVDDDDEIVYVLGSSLSTIGGQSRSKIAGINISDGTATDLNLNPTGFVGDISLDEVNDVLYVAGTFTEIAGETYTPSIAKIDISTGIADTSWNPESDLGIDNATYFVVYHEGSVILAEETGGVSIRMMDPNDSSNVSTWEYALSASNAFGGFKVLDDMVVPLKATGAALQTLPIPTADFNTTSGSISEESEEITLNIDLSEAAEEDIVYTYSLGGTATGGGVDYSLDAGTFTISSGSSSATLSLSIQDDSLQEDTETVTVTIDSGVFGALGVSDLTYTFSILNDDTSSGGGGGTGTPSSSSGDDTDEDNEEEADEEEELVEELTEEETTEDEVTQTPTEEPDSEVVTDTNTEPEVTEVPAEIVTPINVPVKDPVPPIKDPVQVEEPTESETPVSPPSEEDPVVIADEDYPTSDEILEDFIQGQLGVDDQEGEEEREMDPENLDNEEEHELKCELKDEVAQLRANIVSTRDGYRNGRLEIMQSRADVLNTLRDDYRLNISQIRDQVRSKLENERNIYKDNSSALRLTYAESLTYIKENYAKEISNLKAFGASSEDIAELRSGRKTKIQEAKALFKSQIAKEKLEYQTRTAEIKAQLASAKDEAKSAYLIERESVNASYSKKLAAYQADYLVRLESYKKQVSELNSTIKSLYGGSCEIFNEDIEDEGDEDDEDGQDDEIEDVLGTDTDNEDTDDDGIDDIDEAFLTFTDPNNPDGNETTAGVTGQSSSSGSKTVKAEGSIVISGINPEGTQLSCVVEKSPSSTSAVSQYSCDEKYIQDDRGVYMLEFEPRDGDGEYTIRISDSNGIVERFNLQVNSGYRIGMPDLYDFEGYRSDSFNYVTDNQIVVKPKVGSFPTTIVDPTGCVAFGQCIVQARWNSLIFSSIILADSSAGRAVITPPKELEPGDHRVLLTTVDTETNEVSETLEVNFVVDPEIEDVEPNTKFIILTPIQWLLVILLLLLILYMIRKESTNQSKHK